MGTSCKVKVMTDWVKGEISWGMIRLAGGFLCCEGTTHKVR